MSFNYKCGQYDDAFSPRALKNWSDRTKPCRKYRSQFNTKFRGDPTEQEFIADDNGHLLPHVKAHSCKRENLWGLPGICIWDEFYEMGDEKRRGKKYTNEDIYAGGVEDMPTYFPAKPRKDFLISIEQNPSAAEVKKKFDCDFEFLRRCCPPVVWILGYHHKSTQEIRKKFGLNLALALNFNYIDPEESLQEITTKYMDFEPNLEGVVDDAGDSRRINCPPFPIMRLLCLIKSILTYSEALNTRGVLEVLKTLMLTKSNRKGFVIDGFPVNPEEAKEFERYFWPSACSIYFVSLASGQESWSSCSLSPSRPFYFRRSRGYKEALVDQTLHLFSYKSIKVTETECLRPPDINFLAKVANELINEYLDFLGRHPINLEPIALDDTQECFCRQRTPVEEEEEEIEEEEESSEDERSSSDDEEVPEVEADDEEEPEEEPPSEEEEIKVKPVRNERLLSLESRIVLRFRPEDEVEELNKVEKHHKSKLTFYKIPHEVYSHNIPDREGPETRFNTARRHIYLDKVTNPGKKRKVHEIDGKEAIIDPLKPPKPRGWGKGNDQGLDISSKAEDEAYVKRVLELEKKKKEQDIEDYKMRRRLSYTTYRPEPHYDPQTVKALFPPVAKMAPKEEIDEEAEMHRLSSLKYLKKEKDEYKSQDYTKHKSILGLPGTKKGIVESVGKKITKFKEYFSPNVKHVKESAHERLEKWKREHPEGWTKEEYEAKLSEFRLR